MPASALRATADPPVATASRTVHRQRRPRRPSRAPPRSSARAGRSTGGSPATKRSVRERTPIGIEVAQRRRPPSPTISSRLPAAEVDRQQRVGRAGGDHARGRRARPPRRPSSTRGTTPGRGSSRSSSSEALAATRAGAVQATTIRSAPRARASAAIWRTVSSTRSRPSARIRPAGLQARRRGRSSRCRSRAAPPGRRSARATSSRVVLVPTSIAAIGRGGDAGSSVRRGSLGPSTSGGSLAPPGVARPVHAVVTGRRGASARAVRAPRDGAGAHQGEAATTRRRRGRASAGPATTPRAARRRGEGGEQEAGGQARARRGRRSRRSAGAGGAARGPRGGAGRARGGAGASASWCGAGGCVHGGNSSSSLGREQVFGNDPLHGRRATPRARLATCALALRGGPRGENPLPMGGRMGCHVG